MNANCNRPGLSVLEELIFKLTVCYNSNDEPQNNFYDYMYAVLKKSTLVIVFAIEITDKSNS